MSQDPLDVYPAADTAAMLATLAIKPVCERYTEMLQARRLAHTDCARGVVSFVASALISVFRAHASRGGGGAVPSGARAKRRRPRRAVRREVGGLTKCVVVRCASYSFSSARLDMTRR